MRSFFLLFVILLSISSSFAQKTFRPIPGGIPLKYGGYPATDLVLGDKVLLPEEAHQYYLEMNRETRGKWTLADLEPEENKYWKNSISQPLSDSLDDIPVKEELDEVSFVSYALTRTENYRFTVTKDNSFYVVYIGPKVHNFLLRKNLLRKLGYNVEPVKYLKSLKVVFNDSKERDNLLQDAQASVLRDTESRWITSSPEGKNYFYAQDVIIMEEKNAVNLSVGVLDKDQMEGRRVLNSLLVPYALTEWPESINMLSWVHGRVFSENILLPYENGEIFTPSFDDGLWIARRILALTEQDWREIANNTHVPEPVAELLFEKLKSRRNHLGSLFKLTPKKLPVNADYTDQDGIVKNGKLEKEFFDGYGRRFKFTDPNPMSFSEMVSLAKAKTMNKGIELMVTTFNSANFMSNDIEKKITEINNGISAEAAKKLQEGKPLKGLVDSYAMPTVSGKIILGRDIIAGSYLGTDNMIQLADSIGISATVGAYGGVGGIFAKTGEYSPLLDGNSYMPVTLHGTAGISLTRTYAHIRPIKSITQALKYPFKNMIIPLLKKTSGDEIKKISNRDFDAINAMAAKERADEYDKMYSALTKTLEVGESMIITDSLGVSPSVEVGLNLYEIVNVRGKAAASAQVISRLHILRKSEAVIQIYKDLGQNNSIELTFSMDKFIPILKVTGKGSMGTAKTEFYNIRLTSQDTKLKDKINALGAAIKSNSLSLMKKEMKPFEVSHSFTEKSPGAGFLIFRINKLDSTDKIKIVSPEGGERNYIRRYRGYSAGMDFESYAEDMVSLISSKIFKSQFSPGAFSASNPGFTFYGKAVNKLQVFEGELSKTNELSRPYSRLSRIWNGWEMKKKGALKILEKIKKRYKFNFMPSEVLNQTKKLFLYNFSVTLYVHKEGTTALMTQTDDQIKSAFKLYQSRDMTNFTGEDVMKGTGYQKIIKWKKEYVKELAKKNYNKASDILLKMIAHIEKKLSVLGYEVLFGDKDNFLLRANLDGFRIGDEKGDVPLESSTFGTVGNEGLGGPTADFIDFFRQSGHEPMTDGEYYVNWLLGRVL